jgi:hypothetical protein
MVARMALPRLGGAPAVWNSAMLVYQALLLAGYAYAHWLGRLAPRRQAFVHLTLFGLAALTLPISLIAGTPGPNANIFLWVPWLLLVSVGPLFLVISAQAPLIQRWFALAGGGDPYPLYAASNLGSFLGLITYPLVMEPLLSVAAQSTAWSIGYGGLALLVAGCALLLPQGAAIASAATTAPKPTPRTIMRWIGISAIPSGLMLSTTLHVTTDVVAMPLLWVLPLGLYLLSFSVAFATRRGPANTIIRTAPFALLIVGCSVFAANPQFPLAIAAVALGGMFVVAVALHSMLFDSRPDPAHLTIFYLATSIGGVLGGLFCALIAPLSFDWTYEYPLLLIAAAAVIVPVNPFARLGALWDGSTRARRLTGWLMAAALIISIVGKGASGSPMSDAVSLASLAALIGLSIAAIGNRALFAAVAAALMLTFGGWQKIDMSRSDQMTRSFFGVNRVETVDGKARLLVHGTTVHGVQNLGSPAMERVTTSYYAPRSGVGLAMAAAPSIFPNARVGVVGLGAGTLSCASSPRQSWRFYEIDSEVAEIARKDFSYLARCQPKAPILIGDARLTLEREPRDSADVLVIDAFSSDAIPMHLLTLEAFNIYRNHLSSQGLLMVHISNRYLDLRPVLAAAAAHGWTARVRYHSPNEEEKKLRATASMWVALSPSYETIAKLERSSAEDSWLPLPKSDSVAWTDDHASVLPLIIWDQHPGAEPALNSKKLGTAPGSPGK